MAEVVIVHSETEQGAQALLDCVCRSGELVPVVEPRLMLGRANRWEAFAAPAGQPTPPLRRASNTLERRIRRGHR